MAVKNGKYRQGHFEIIFLHKMFMAVLKHIALNEGAGR